MEKKIRNTTAKRCLGIDPDAPRKRRSKRLKSPSVGITTMEEGGNGTMGEKERDESPNVRENLDCTHTTPRSPLPSDSPASRTRGALRKLASRCQASPIVDRSQDVGENTNVSEPIMQQVLKKRRGPTKMKTIAIGNKVDITFNEYGQSIEEALIGMASFLGPLVREVVPVTLNDWRKLSTRFKEILWTSIQSRYNMNEDWQRKFIFQKMGRLWRAGKSRIVSQIQNASNDEEVLKMKPANIQSTHDWIDFVKEKNSARFKARSEKFKSMKKRQLPHTCSRKGYARLAEEMKKSCSGSSSVTRVALWAKAHRKKDGNPINSQERIEKIDNEGTNTTSNNVANDAISKVLGPDRGHIRGLGFGVTLSKLSLLSQRDSNYAKLEEKYKKMEGQMSEMKSLMSHILKSQGNASEQLSNATNDPMVNNTAINPIVSSPSSINNNNALRKCMLVDWCGTGEVVAEGRWSSNDPKVIVHHVPLGPHAVRVWVDLPKKPDAFLWRPNSEMTYIEDAVGSTVAWPFDKVMIS